MNQSIGILLISTWKYNQFINLLISDIRKYFFPNNDIKIFLHTDSTEKHDADTTIKIEHQPWPIITLNRFNIFCTHEQKYNTDYLFYLDIDCRIIDYIEEDILSDFTVVEHHWFIGSRGTPETNPASLAYISPNENITYVAGGFFGGSRNRFLSVSQIIDHNIKVDFMNNIIALWHYESHLNRYVASNMSTTKIISSEYLYSPSNIEHPLPNPKIIPFLDSEKGFDKFENMVHK